MSEIIKHLKKAVKELEHGCPQLAKAHVKEAIELLENEK